MVTPIEELLKLSAKPQKIWTRPHNSMHGPSVDIRNPTSFAWLLTTALVPYQWHW
jgi:hypothetical protein